MIASGRPAGWGAAVFFGLCLLAAIVEPWFPKSRASCEYTLRISQDQVVCKRPRRPPEAIPWADVERIWYVTTSDGPGLPDQWLLLEGERGACLFPTEAEGFDGIWDVLKQRFSGFDYEALIRGGTDDARYLCWEREPSSGSSA
jgi:hypothetical protein